MKQGQQLPETLMQRIARVLRQSRDSQEFIGKVGLAVGDLSAVQRSDLQEMDDDMLRASLVELVNQQSAGGSLALGHCCSCPLNRMLLIIRPAFALAVCCQYAPSCPPS